MTFSAAASNMATMPHNILKRATKRQFTLQFTVMSVLTAETCVGSAAPRGLQASNVQQSSQQTASSSSSSSRRCCLLAMLAKMMSNQLDANVAG